MLLEILSRAKTPPFAVCNEPIEVSEELRLRYRYLDIRRGNILHNLTLRHKATMSVRSFFDEKQFTEVTTPILCKSTPEGARSAAVRRPGDFG